jgi:hypothetical protein
VRREGDPVGPDLILARVFRQAIPLLVSDFAWLQVTWFGRGRNAGGDMLSCGAVRSLLGRLRPPLRGWNSSGPAMPPSAAAANRACLCSFGQSIAQGEGGHVMLPRKAAFIDLGPGKSFALLSALSLKGSVDGDALGIKAEVLTTPRQLLRDPEVLPLEEVGGKGLNGNGACRRGKPLGFPQHPGAAKMVVAVDVDEGIVKKHETRRFVSEIPVSST